MNSNSCVTVPMSGDSAGSFLLPRLRAEARALFNDLEEGHCVEPSLLAAHIIECNSSSLAPEERAALRPALAGFVENMVRLTYPE